MSILKVARNTKIPRLLSIFVTKTRGQDAILGVGDNPKNRTLPAHVWAHFLFFSFFVTKTCLIYAILGRCDMRPKIRFSGDIFSWLNENGSASRFRVLERSSKMADIRGELLILGTRRAGRIHLKIFQNLQFLFSILLMRSMMCMYECVVLY